MNLDELMKQKELLQQKLGLEGEVLFETALVSLNSCSSCRGLPGILWQSRLFSKLYLEMLGHEFVVFKAVFCNLEPYSGLSAGFLQNPKHVVSVALRIRIPL
jgi:hypothetical protein